MRLYIRTNFIPKIFDNLQLFYTFDGLNLIRGQILKRKLLYFKYLNFDASFVNIEMEESSYSLKT